MSNYRHYLQNFSLSDPELYYADSFEERNETESVAGIHMKEESLTEKVTSFLRKVKKTKQ